MVFCSDDLVSVIPANRVVDEVFSHQGLTYGGFVLKEKEKLGDVLAIAKSVLKFLNDKDIKNFIIKLITVFRKNIFI